MENSLHVPLVMLLIGAAAIRRLTPADLVELGLVICASSGCVHDAHWEVAKESASLPNAGPGTFQTVRFYCDSTWKPIVEPPRALRLN